MFVKRVKTDRFRLHLVIIRVKDRSRAHIIYTLGNSRWEQFRDVAVNLFVQTRVPLLDH